MNKFRDWLESLCPTTGDYRAVTERAIIGESGSIFTEDSVQRRLLYYILLSDKDGFVSAMKKYDDAFKEDSK